MNDRCDHRPENGQITGHQRSNHWFYQHTDEAEVWSVTVCYRLPEMLKCGLDASSIRFVSGSPVFFNLNYCYFAFEENIKAKKKS